jgi:hypothetical protein
MMGAKFNPATGQMEDDPAATGVPPLLAPPVSPPPVAPAPVAPPPVTPPSPAPAPVTSPIAPAKPTAAPVGMGLPVTSQTISGGTVASTIVSPEMKAADKETAAAVEQGRKANEADAAIALREAEIKQHDLAIEAEMKRAQIQQDKVRADQAERAHAALEQKAAEDEDSYRAAAASSSKDFWGKDGNETETRKSWALSLMFGTIAHAFGGENVGERLLDKAMKEWTDGRAANLAQLEKRALASSGLLRTFWADHGIEAKAHKELQDAGAKAAWADQIEELGVKSRGLISDRAAAANDQVVARYRQSAADNRAKAVELRASKATSGSSSTTYTATKPGEAGAGNELMVQDSAGNAYQAVSKADAAKVRDSKGRLDEAVPKIDDVINQLKTNGPGWFGKVKSTGQPARELEGQIASLAAALSQAQGDPSARNVAAIKARFAPDRWTNQQEAIDDLTRVRDETIRAHDATVGAATGRKISPAKPGPASGGALPPGATPGEYHGKKGYRIGKDFYAQE